MNPDPLLHANVVRVVNRTRGTLVAARAQVARSFAARLRGLLGRRGLAPGEGLVLLPCSSIHTFFMRFPIDAAFVAADGTAVRVISGLRPFRATRLYPRARLCLETAAGALAASSTREGDVLGWEVAAAP